MTRYQAMMSALTATGRHGGGGGGGGQGRRFSGRSGRNRFSRRRFYGFSGVPYGYNYGYNYNPNYYWQLWQYIQRLQAMRGSGQVTDANQIMYLQNSIDELTRQLAVIQGMLAVQGGQVVNPPVTPTFAAPNVQPLYAPYPPGGYGFLG